MFEIAALYRFTPFESPAALAVPLRARLEELDVRGSLLLAPEGINGTIAALAPALEAALETVRELSGCATLQVKRSQSEHAPFGKLKVRVKREIVTMGVPQVDPTAAVGRYVAPADWNALIAAEDVAVIDTRNAYEVGIGSFDGAVDPDIARFRDFPIWWQNNRARFEGKRIAMFCTGGIRCEKSTNYLISQGVEEVFHLRGGILQYLEDVPEEESLWKGACFVFDERVSVLHGLREGDHQLCRACREPLEPEDMTRPEYEAGVACHRCHARTTAVDKERFRERQRQILLARQRRQALPETQGASSPACQGPGQGTG
jgi:UPF0176 protein